MRNGIKESLLPAGALYYEWVDMGTAGGIYRIYVVGVAGVRARIVGDVDYDQTSFGEKMAKLITGRYNAHDALVAAVKDLLGDGPDLVELDCGGHQGGNGFECRHCGRVYEDDDVLDDMPDGNCPSDDCPGHKARAALEKAKGL